ncbi:MAG: hypothetical protein RL653_313 [Pseudomonadota bacterium]|jgi:hypothetical protein
MHPTLAHFLDLHVAWETLDRARKGAHLEEPGSSFAATAEAFPDLAAAVLAGKEGPKAGEEAERSLVLMAAIATVASLEMQGSTELSDAVREAHGVLRGAGADVDQSTAFIAQLVMEEAFAFEGEADAFNEPLFLESLRSLGPLLALEEPAVTALVQAFVDGAPARKGALYRDAALGLLEQAWSEGVEPVSPEHVSAARQALGKRAGAAEALSAFLDALEAAKLCGPLRKAELLKSLD